MLINIKYVECPQCETWFSTSELLSYSSHGKNTSCRSDGKCSGQALPEYSFLPYSRCDNCKAFFWFDNCRSFTDADIDTDVTSARDIRPDAAADEKTQKAVRDFLKDYKQEYLKNTSDLSLNYPPPEHWFNLPHSFIKDYMEILKDNELSTENEIFIRIKLWQHISDLVNNAPPGRSGFNIRLLFHRLSEKLKNKQAYRAYEKIREKNISILIRLLEGSPEKATDKSPLLIELKRQAGKFDEAKELIDNTSREELNYYKNFIRKSKKMIKRKSTRTFWI